MLKCPTPLLLALPLLPCASAAPYGEELSFLRQHLQVVELTSGPGKARIAVIPAYEGRVMTSTAQGGTGTSFGWINHELIASGEIRPHMNAFGGENRLWLGPEGGPFALFFSSSAPSQTLPHWQTPALFDSKPWPVTEQGPSAVVLSASGSLTNRAGTTFTFLVTRRVRMLPDSEARNLLGGAVPSDVAWVGYETRDRLMNTGGERWGRPGGMPSIWTLGQFQPGQRATIVVPIVPGTEAKLGPRVRSDYFGPISADRLAVNPDFIAFRADGQSRGKIGVSPRRAKPVVGSWDAERQVLTIVTFNLPTEAARRPYVDSRWIDSGDPFAGDVVNAYDDGPPSPGAPPLGPFYEIETSSPAAELAPHQSIVHLSRTFHFVGNRASLDRLSRHLLGMPLDAIESALPTH